MSAGCLAFTAVVTLWYSVQDATAGYEARASCGSLGRPVTTDL